jgi:AcrR family transcriptional regulator
MSAEERREDILAAAMAEFAATGYHGTSTETIARRAGISQPYLFRLFGTKKELFLACVKSGFGLTLDAFQQAAAGKRGQEAFAAMGAAYMELLADRSLLLAQMQSYAACDDAEVRGVVRRSFGDLFSYVERATGALPADVSRFFAKGMLLNVGAAMDLLGADEAWAKRLIDGCRES